jgi:DNA-binding transcriptional regulator GbsR (MarR family)
MNENLVPKNEKLEAIKSINNLLNNFSNEIPEKMAEDKEIRFTEKYYHLKVRTNWFTGVFHLLWSLENQFPKDFMEEISIFLKNLKKVTKKIRQEQQKKKLIKQMIY